MGGRGASEGLHALEKGSNSDQQFAVLTSLFRGSCTQSPSCPFMYPRPPLSFPTPGKTVPRHPLGDGHQVTAPHHPPGNRSTAIHTHCGAQKLRQKTK